MKPAKAGKDEIPAQAASGLPHCAPEGQSTFEDALRSIQEDLAIKLWEDARNCEHSTEAAILAAPPAEKFSAFRSGIDEWGNKFRASITEYYKKCFVIARRNRVQHNYLLSLGKISSTDKFRNPAEFAKALTAGEIS